MNEDPTQNITSSTKQNDEEVESLVETQANSVSEQDRSLQAEDRAEQAGELDSRISKASRIP